MSAQSRTRRPSVARMDRDSGEQPDREESNRERLLGTTTAVGIGLGAAVFAATGEVIWVGIGAALGIVIGAAIGYREQ